MAGSVRTKSLDFSGGPTAASPLEVRVGAPEFEIESVTGTVYYRLRLDQGPWKQLQENTTFTARQGDGDFDFLYLHSEGDASAAVDLAIREDFCKYVQSQTKVEVDGTISTQSVAGQDPYRLTGDLAAGTVINDGDEASEQIDVSDLVRCRIRARVTGISSATAVGAAGRNGAGHVVGYATPAGEARVATVDVGGQTIRVYDASDPENLVQLGSFNDGALGTAWAALTIDEADEKALVVVSDGGATSTLMAVMDISDPTAISVDGSVVYDTNDTVSDRPQRWPQVDPGRDLVAVLNLGDLFLVDYSNPSSPTLADTLAGTFTGGIAIAPSEAVLFVPDIGSGVMTLHVVGYAGGGLTDKVQTNFSGVPYSPPAVVDWEAGRSLLYLLGDSSGLAVIDGSDPLDPVALSESSFTELELNDFDFAADGDAELLHFKGSDDRDLYRAVDVSTPSSPTVQVAIPVEPSTGVAGGGIQGVDYASGVGSPFWIEEDDDVLGTVRLVLGRDELRFFYLDPSGARVASNNPTAVTLEDGREAILEAEIRGEHAADVEIAARSGQAATVDYVDVYPEEM